jgi:ABC-type phosphate/phosphonate transport system ATPase subunit
MASSSMAMRFTDEDRTMAIEALDRLDLVPQALQRAGTLVGRPAAARRHRQGPGAAAAHHAGG